MSITEFPITPIDPGSLTYEDPAESHPRTAGVHVGAVVMDLYYRVMKSYPAQDKSTSGVRSTFESGFIWERLLERAWRERQSEREALLHGVARPPELEMDGLYMHPDGLGTTPQGLPLTMEYKLTTRSAAALRDFENQFPHWLMQAAAYSLKMGCMSVRWLVMCVGRAQLYNTDPWTACASYQVDHDWKPGEREHYWDIVKGHAGAMRRQGLIKQTPEGIWTTE